MFPRNDFYRAGEASRVVEARYGLTTAASDRTAAKRPTYAETQKAARRGQAEPVRDTLRRQVRTAAAGATTITEFLERLRRDGVLVHERHRTDPGELTGYAVASAESVDAQGKPVYYGGGRLAADLTLPKLRARWEAATVGEPATAGGGPPCDRRPVGRAPATPVRPATGRGSRRRSASGSGSRPPRPRRGPLRRSGTTPPPTPASPGTRPGRPGRQIRRAAARAATSRREPGRVVVQVGPAGRAGDEAT